MCIHMHTHAQSIKLSRSNYLQTIMLTVCKLETAQIKTEICYLVCVCTRNKTTIFNIQEFNLDYYFHSNVKTNHDCQV